MKVTTLLSSPSSQQNHKRKPNSPFPCNKAKKVAAALVFFFFNIKLQPSLLCYKGKKRAKQQKKKVTATVVAFFVKLRFQKREKKAMAALLSSPASLRCSITESPSSVAL